MLKLKYIYIALILYVITAYFSAGHNSPDEYYQILEFGAYKLGFGNPKFLTWEYHSQIRSALQPFIVVYIYKIFAAFSLTNPFFITFITRLLSGLLSLLSVFVFIHAFSPSIKNEMYKKWFILLSLFTWLIVYNSIRFSGENISAKLFLLGFSLVFLPNLRKSAWIYIGIGLLLGFSFIARFQCGALILGLLLWLIFINNYLFVGIANGKVITKLNFTVMVGGILVAILVGVFIDKWFYGNFTFTAWNYLNMNIFKGKAATFGEESWAFYLLVMALLPYGPLFVVSSVIALIYKVKHPVVWVTFLFIILHIVVGHKELRFLVPVLCYMPLLIMYSFEILNTRFNLQFGNWWCRIWLYAWRFNCVLVIFVAILPSAIQLPLCKAIYDRYNTPIQFNYITEGGNELDFYKKKNVELVQINAVKELKCDKTKICLLALTCQQVRDNELITKNKIVYENCPSWLLKLNFNGWLDRTAVYNIYEIK